MKTNRIEALCDGIFAVAMTILVLSIAIPNARTVPPAELPGALRHLGSQVLVYAISFINLGVLWVGQHNQYHFIKLVDRWFIWINIGFLMVICFIPFSTALLGQYPFERPALFVYGANVILATLVLGFHWRYASSRLILQEPLTPQVVRLGMSRILISAVAYLCALLLAFVSPEVSLALFLLVPLTNILPYSIDVLLKPRE